MLLRSGHTDDDRCGQLLRGSATLRAAAQLAGPCHDVDHLLENLELDAFAAAGAYEFGFIVQPLKIRGASGSAIAQIAIR